MPPQTWNLFSYTTTVYQRIRRLADTFLRSFGIHCATHQIRLILVSAVVITSLSYPALAIYSSTPSYSRLASTSNVVDSFLADYVAFGSDALRDIQNFWQGQPNIQTLDDELIRARCGSDRTLRVERILIHSSTLDVAGALTNQTLLSALHLERRILERVKSQGIPCLEAGPSNCVVFSPLAFWDYDEARIRSDTNIPTTLKNHDGVSVAGIPVTPQMVLAGRTLERGATSNIDAAKFLVHTFIFPETDCLHKASHDTWLDILKNLTQGNDAFTETIEPTLIALQYDHGLSKKQGFSSISSFVYLAYVIFFAYVRRSMKRMNGVHNRAGLTFTALFEIAASTITSLSVCSLMRFKVTMVPWSLLPILIIFVGAENMFNLVDAVTKTSVTLPVKERIAEGLSRAGLSNTLKVVGYNCILGVIARCSTGAISQFCTFAVVVLVAHWFLAHTFFLAVLSIDIQRLELEELIRQNPSLTPCIAGAQQETPPSAPTGWRKIFTYQLKVVLKGRAITNISLLLLLATTATLYVLTRPSGYDAALAVTFSPSFPMFVKPTLNQTQDPSWWLWKVLNPEEHPLVHLRVEVPTIVAFQPAGTVSQSVQQSFWSSTSTLDIVLWLLKILPVPMALTLLPLYALLLYLLKDAELLEAQRNRDDGNAESGKTEIPLRDHILFSTLRRGFATDVELLAASENGQVIAAVGLQNEVSLWRINDTEPVVVVSLNPLSTDTVCALALDDGGDFLALGNTSGTVHLFAVTGKDVKRYKPLLPPDNSAGVAELRFYRPSSFTSKQKAGLNLSWQPPTILVCYGNGVVMEWNTAPLPSASPIKIKPVSSSAVLRSSIISVQSMGYPLVAFCLDDGSIEVAELNDTPDIPHIRCSLLAGSPVDRVAKVYACQVKLSDKEQTIFGVATEAGVISIWDADTSECLLVVDEPHGAVDQLRLAPIHLETCHLCGELPMDSLVATLSVGPTVTIYRAYLPSSSRRCSCPGSAPQACVVLDSDRRSRSNSTVSLSPFLRRLSSASMLSDSDAASFPVSGHGILSRRVSEKESLRRPETLALVDECEVGYAFGPLDRLSSRTDIKAVKVGEATSERGGWDIAGGRVLGIRRISRLQGVKSATSSPASASRSGGLTSAALGRWECWSYELASSTFRTSVMSSLSDDRHPSSSPITPSSANQDYPRLPFTRVVAFQASHSLGMAGFGNTVGVFHFS